MESAPKQGLALKRFFLLFPVIGRAEGIASRGWVSSFETPDLGCGTTGTTATTESGFHRDLAGMASDVVDPLDLAAPPAP